MQASSCEYLEILDRAVAEKDPVKRLALLSVYYMVQFNHVERSAKKPFNPMLGETYELFVPNKY